MPKHLELSFLWFCAVRLFLRRENFHFLVLFLILHDRSLQKSPVAVKMSSKCLFFDKKNTQTEKCFHRAIKNVRTSGESEWIFVWLWWNENIWQFKISPSSYNRRYALKWNCGNLTDRILRSFLTSSEAAFYFWTAKSPSFHIVTPQYILNLICPHEIDELFRTFFSISVEKSLETDKMET